MKMFREASSGPGSDGDGGGGGHYGYDVELVGDNIFHWLVRFYGPEDTPYHGGTFTMAMILESNFPAFPPRCRFIGSIPPHVNISSQGRVCHSVLERDWTPNTSLKLVLDCIYGLFLTPEPEDPLDTVLATLLLSDREQYQLFVGDWMTRHFPSRLPARTVVAAMEQ